MKKSKAKKEPTYCLTVSQLEAMKLRAVREATEAAWILMSAIPVMVLMDKHGFDREQLGKVVDEILEKYAAGRGRDGGQAAGEEGSENYLRNFRQTVARPAPLDAQ